jgi:uncharacterized repeat protein (TIGR01451 family)
MKPFWKIAALFGVVISVVLVAVPIASAHHPVVVASLACDGTVTFTVTADVQDSTRNNADVTLIDTSGNSQPIAVGAFDSANNWSFSGTFLIPTTVTSDTLTPQARGIWGDGWQPTNGPPTTITRPQHCPPVAPVSAPAATLASAPPAPASTTPSAPATPSNPAIAISKNPKTQTIASGSTATFTIMVTNTGDIALTDVFVTDALSPTCNETASTIPGLATMAPGASVLYTCASPNVTASFTNVATDTGTPPSGPNVTSTDTAVVLVTAPFTPPTPSATKKMTLGHRPAAPISGITSFSSSKPAPFTPPSISTARLTTPKPKLVSHVSPTTAG